MPAYLADEWLDQIGEEAREIAEANGDEVATTWSKLARGEGTRLVDMIEPWLTEQADFFRAQTAAQHRAVLKRFLGLGWWRRRLD